MTNTTWKRLEKGTMPAWWGKEDPKVRARRLWAKKAPWSKSRGKCFREGEAGPDEGPPGDASGAA